MRTDDVDKEVFIKHLQIYCFFGEVSFLCDIPQPSTVRASEFCKVLRLDKNSLMETLKIYYADGRIILNNLLEVCSPWKIAFCLSSTFHSMASLVLGNTIT